jgi:phage baseplate assembly protein W
LTTIDGSFTGSGFAYPWGITPQGGFQMVSGQQNVERAMRLILGTAYGERPMRPEFGCGIHDMLFEPGTAELLSRIQLEVRNSLLRWEPRADVIDVVATYDEDPSKVWINVRYQLKGSYDPRNLLVPFYVIPTEVEP